LIGPFSIPEIDWKYSFTEKGTPAFAEAKLVDQILYIP
jgi:hypothetical protein